MLRDVTDDRPIWASFDSEKAEARKERGMEEAAANRSELLKLAQGIARRLSYENERVTADDVQAELIKRGHKPSELGNAAGSIFRGDRWRCVGVENSRRVTNNSRLVRVWRYEP